MVELIMIGLGSLIFGIAGTTGYYAHEELKKSGNEVKIEQTVDQTPSKFKPNEHQDMMMQCLVMCGKDNVLKYSSIIGECECKK